MDRFKFRAWDGQFKTMAYGSLTQDRWYSKTGFLDVSSGGLEGCDIMQCTGLKDMEGHHVFEGDRFEGEEPQEYYLVVWNANEARFQLDYYGFDEYTGEGGQEVFASEISRIDENMIDMSSVSVMKVIGNIYQALTP